MNILIFGINGNLGRYLSEFLQKKHVICSYESKDKILFRLPNTKKVVQSILDFKPDIIINLVAYADVDACEKDIQIAYTSNVLSVTSIVESINSDLIKVKPHLIHISTDHVYNGNGFNKENEIKLLNNYAFTKFLGEEMITNCSNTILRTNYIGKSRVSKNKSLGDWIVNSLSNNKEIVGFSDIKFNPIHVYTLCKIIDLVCKKKINGTYNVGAKDSVSKYEYAVFLAKELNLNPNLIKKGLSKTDVTKRSCDMRKDVKKFEQDFDYQMTSMYDELLNNIKDYKKYE